MRWRPPATGKRLWRCITCRRDGRDPDVDALPCWTPALQPGGEIARLAVHPDFQNRGLARRLVRFIMEELARRGCRSIRLIVNCRNEKALRSYAAFRFRTAGECDMYSQHFLCYEKALEPQPETFP